MKQIFLILIIFSFAKISAQEQIMTAAIPKRYRDAKTYSLVNKDSSRVITFKRDGKNKYITEAGKISVLKNRKDLLSYSGEVMATYKKNQIIFPSKNTIIQEKKIKKGWEYYVGSDKILSVNYKLDYDTRVYSVTTKYKELDEKTVNLLYMSLGKIDRKMPMQHTSLTMGEHLEYAFVAATVVVVGSLVK